MATFYDELNYNQLAPSMSIHRIIWLPVLYNQFSAVTKLDSS